MKILLGTKNPGKIREIQKFLADLTAVELLFFSDQPFADVEESGSTFLENARLKARSISTQTGLCVLADDTGLQVDSLDQAPGIYSARFAGTPPNDENNRNFLLEKLEGVKERQARFVTAVCLHLANGTEFITEGVLSGKIARTPAGTNGFGYDPLFIPEDYSRTLAQLSLKEKNQISHRQQAIAKMKQLLEKLTKAG